MKLLVTGGSGFLGSEVLKQALKNAFFKEIYSAGLTRSNIRGVKNVVVDLRKSKNIKRLAKLQPDAVIHLAGAALVSAKQAFKNHFESNFLTTTHLLEALSHNPKPFNFFFSSSIHVYGNSDELAHEQLTPQPVNVYGFTKFLCEKLIQKKAEEKPGQSWVVGRLSSCTGPGQRQGFVISDWMQKLKRSPKLKTLNLDGFRYFMDVRDAATAILSLMEKAPKGFSVYNIASPKSIELRNLVGLFENVIGKKIQIEESKTKMENAFLGVRLSLEKLQKTIPATEFRSLEQTLSEMWIAS